MKYQVSAITYFIMSISIFVLVLNGFLIWLIKPKFLWRKSLAEAQMPIVEIVLALALFIASFFLGMMGYIMKLYNGFVL